MHNNSKKMIKKTFIAQAIFILTSSHYALADESKTDIIYVVGSIAKTSGSVKFYDTQATNVIDEKTISEKNYEKVDQTLSYTAGAQQGMYGHDSRSNWLKMRGLDVSYTYDGSPQISTGYFGDTREVYGLERVEVLKGASSLLYGSSKPGGTINLISKRPTEKPQGEIKLFGGTQNNYGIGGDYSGALSDDNSVRYRVVGHYRDSDGQQDHTGLKSYYFAPSVIWDINENTAITLLASWQKSEGMPENGFFTPYGTIINTPNGKIDRNTYFGEPGYNHYKKTNDSIGYEFIHLFDNGITFTQNYKYTHEDLNIRGVYASYAIPETQQLVRNSYAQIGSMNAHTIDNRLSKTFEINDWRDTLLIGADYNYTSMSGRDFNNYGDSTVDLHHPQYGFTPAEPFKPFSLKANEYGLYMQNQLVYNNKLILNQGVRYNHVNNHGYWDSSDFDRNYGHTTYSAGAMYIFDNDIAPYFNYSESFQPVYGYSNSQQTIYKPYTAKQWESGIKYSPDWLNGEMVIDYFHITAQNSFFSNGTGQAAQALESRNKGVEFQLNSQVTDNVNLAVSYTYTDSQTDTSTTQSIQSPLIPKNAASIWGYYTFTEGSLAGLTMGTGIRYVGTTKDESTLPNDKIPDYTIWDAMVKYQLNSSWSLQVNGTNLTNKNYISGCSYWCYYGAERSLVASMIYHW
ncbi:TonB-dependent siderophore receptor [Utexia brackfieldae]|uniref:TonB-dependent siderophore receptor n=1 Tax=Utexia brackfieldae TaxID=3074108 RepID=UPI00370D952D